MSVLSQLGFAKETVYGTPVTVDKFLEFVSESVAGKYERIESEGLRAGSRVQRADRWAPNFKGAGGDVQVEVPTKGLAFLLPHLMGSYSTVAANADGFVKHTARIGPMKGRSLTLQVGRMDATDTVKPFTYAGTKVAGFEITNDVDGMLLLNLMLDAQKAINPGDTGAPALATVTYPVGVQLLSYQGASLLIGGEEVPVTDISIKVENGLNVERFFLRSSGLKKEPNEAELRVIEWSATCEFEGETQIKRIASATAAGALATLKATWTAPEGVGATKPSLEVIIPAARFDSEMPKVEGQGTITHEMGGKGLDDLTTDSPITINYMSTDAVVV